MSEVQKNAALELLAELRAEIESGRAEVVAIASTELESGLELMVRCVRVMPAHDTGDMADALHRSPGECPDCGGASVEWAAHSKMICNECGAAFAA